MLGKVLCNHIEGVEQSELECQVGLVSGLPGDGIICISGNAHTFVCSLPILSKGSGICIAVHIHIGKIVETVLRITDIVITHKSVRITQLEIVDIFGYRLEPRFVRNHPGCTYRREETPTVLLVETLGTVVTEVELGKIAFVITVGKTA